MAPDTPSKAASNDTGSPTSSFSSSLASSSALHDTQRAQPPQLVVATEQSSVSSLSIPIDSSHDNAAVQHEEEENGVSAAHHDEEAETRRVSEPLEFSEEKENTTHHNNDTNSNFSLYSKKAESSAERQQDKAQHEQLLVGPLATNTPPQPPLPQASDEHDGDQEEEEDDDESKKVDDMPNTQAQAAASTSASASPSDNDIDVSVEEVSNADDMNAVVERPSASLPLPATPDAAAEAERSAEHEHTREESEENALAVSDASPAPRPPPQQQEEEDNRAADVKVVQAQTGNVVNKEEEEHVETAAVPDLPSRYRNSNESNLTTSQGSSSRGSVERARINSTFVPSQVPAPSLHGEEKEEEEEDGGQQAQQEGRVREQGAAARVTQPLPAVLRVPAFTAYEEVTATSGRSRSTRTKSSRSTSQANKKNKKEKREEGEEGVSNTSHAAHTSQRETSNMTTSYNTTTTTTTAAAAANTQTQLPALHATEASLCQPRPPRQSSNSLSDTQALHTSSQRSWRPSWLPRWPGKRTKVQRTFTQPQQQQGKSNTSMSAQAGASTVGQETQETAEVNVPAAMHAEHVVQPTAIGEGGGATTSVSDEVLHSEDIVHNNTNNSNNNNKVQKKKKESTSVEYSSRHRHHRSHSRQGSACVHRHSVQAEHALPHLTSKEAEDAKVKGAGNTTTTTTTTTLVVAAMQDNQSGNEANALSSSSLAHMPRHIQAASHHHHHGYPHLAPDARADGSAPLDAAGNSSTMRTQASLSATHRSRKDQFGQRPTSVATRRRRTRRRRSRSASTNTPPSQLATLKEDTTRPLESFSLAHTRTSLGRTRERHRRRVSRTTNTTNSKTTNLTHSLSHHAVLPARGEKDEDAAKYVNKGSENDSSAYEYYYTTSSSQTSRSSSLSSAYYTSSYTTLSSSSRASSSPSSVLTASMRRDTQCEVDGVGPLEQFRAFDEGSGLGTHNFTGERTTNSQLVVEGEETAAATVEATQPSHDLTGEAGQEGESKNAVVGRGGDDAEAHEEEHTHGSPSLNPIEEDNAAIDFHREADSALLPVASSASVTVSASTSHLSRIAEAEGKEEAEEGEEEEASSHDVHKEEQEEEGKMEVNAVVQNVQAQQQGEEEHAVQQASAEEEGTGNTEKPLSLPVPPTTTATTTTTTRSTTAGDYQSSTTHMTFPTTTTTTTLTNTFSGGDNDSKETAERSATSPPAVPNTLRLAATAAATQPNGRANEAEVTSIPDLLVLPPPSTRNVKIGEGEKEGGEQVQAIPIVLDMSVGTNTAPLAHTPHKGLRVSGHESVAMPPLVANTKKSIVSPNADVASSASSNAAADVVDAKTAEAAAAESEVSEQEEEKKKTTKAEAEGVAAEEESLPPPPPPLARLVACEAEPPHEVTPMALAESIKMYNAAAKAEQDNASHAVLPAAVHLERGVVLVQLHGLVQLARRLYSDDRNGDEDMNADDTLSSSDALRAVYDATQDEKAGVAAQHRSEVKDLLLRVVLYCGTGEVVAWGSPFRLRDYASRQYTHNNSNNGTCHAAGWSDVLVFTDVRTGSDDEEQQVLAEGQTGAASALLLRLDCVDANTLDTTAVRNPPPTTPTVQKQQQQQEQQQEDASCMPCNSVSTPTATTTLAICATALPMPALLQQVRANMCEGRPSTSSSAVLPASFRVALLATNYAVAQVRAACTQLPMSDGESVYEGMPLLTCHVMAGGCEKYCVQDRLRRGLGGLSSILYALHEAALGSRDAGSTADGSSADRQLIDELYNEDAGTQGPPSATLLQPSSSSVTTVWGSLPVSLRAPLLRRMAAHRHLGPASSSAEQAGKTSQAVSQPSAMSSMPGSALSTSLQISQYNNNSTTARSVLPPLQHRMTCSLLLHCGVAVVDELPGLLDQSDFPVLQLSATGGAGAMLLGGTASYSSSTYNHLMYTLHSNALPCSASRSHHVAQRAPVMRYDYTLQTRLSLAQHPLVLLTLHPSSGGSNASCEVMAGQACFAPFHLPCAPLMQRTKKGEGVVLPCRRAGDVWLPIYAQRTTAHTRCVESKDAGESTSEDHAVQKMRVGWLHCRYDCVYDTDDESDKRNEKQKGKDEETCEDTCETMQRAQDPLEGWADLCVVRAAGLPPIAASTTQEDGSHRCGSRHHHRHYQRRRNAFCEVEAFLMPHTSALKTQQPQDEGDAGSSTLFAANEAAAAEEMSVNNNNNHNYSPGNNKAAAPRATSSCPSSPSSASFSLQAVPCCVTPTVMHDNYPCWRHTFRLYLRDLAALSIVLRDSCDTSPRDEQQQQQQQHPSSLLASREARPTAHVHYIGSVTLSRHALHALLALNNYYNYNYTGVEYRRGCVRGAWLPIMSSRAAQQPRRQHGVWAGALYVTCRPLSTTSSLGFVHRRLMSASSAYLYHNNTNDEEGDDDDGVMCGAAEPLCGGVVSCYAGSPRAVRLRSHVSWLQLSVVLVSWPWLRHVLYSWAAQRLTSTEEGAIEMAACTGETASLVPVYRLRRTQGTKNTAKKTNTLASVPRDRYEEELLQAWLPCVEHGALQLVLYYVPHYTNNNNSTRAESIRLAWATLAGPVWADRVKYFYRREYTLTWRPCTASWSLSQIQYSELSCRPQSAAPQEQQHDAEEKEEEGKIEELTAEDKHTTSADKLTYAQCSVPAWSRLPHYVEPEGLCRLRLTRLPMFDLTSSNVVQETMHTAHTHPLWQWPLTTCAYKADEAEDEDNDAGKKTVSEAGLDVELLDYILFQPPTKDEQKTRDAKCADTQPRMRLLVREEGSDHTPLADNRDSRDATPMSQRTPSSQVDGSAATSDHTPTTPSSEIHAEVAPRAHSVCCLRWQCPQLPGPSTPLLPPPFTLRCYLPHNNNNNNNNTNKNSTAAYMSTVHSVACMPCDCVAATAPLSLDAFDHTSGELWLALYALPQAAASSIGRGEAESKPRHVGFIRVAYVHNFVPYADSLDITEGEEIQQQQQQQEDTRTAEETGDALLAVRLCGLQLRDCEAIKCEAASVQVLLGVDGHTQCLRLPRIAKVSPSEPRRHGELIPYGSHTAAGVIGKSVALLPYSATTSPNSAYIGGDGLPAARQLRVQVLLPCEDVQGRADTPYFAFLPLPSPPPRSNYNNDRCGQSACVPLYSLCKDMQEEGSILAHRVVGEVALQYCIVDKSTQSNVMQYVTQLRCGGPLRVKYVTLPPTDRSAAEHAPQARRTTLLTNSSLMQTTKTHAHHVSERTCEQELMQRLPWPLNEERKTPDTRYLVLTQLVWHGVPLHDMQHPRAVNEALVVRVCLRSSATLVNEKAAPAIYADYATSTTASVSVADIKAETGGGTIVASWPAETCLLLPLPHASARTKDNAMSDSITLDMELTLKHADGVHYTDVAVGQLCLPLPMSAAEHRCVPLTWRRDSSHEIEEEEEERAGMLECCCRCTSFAYTGDAAAAAGVGAVTMQTKDDEDGADVVLTQLSVTQLTLGNVQLAALPPAERATICCTITDRSNSSDDSNDEQQHAACCTARDEEAGWSGTLCLHGGTTRELQVCLTLPASLLLLSHEHTDLPWQHAEIQSVQARAAVLLPADYASHLSDQRSFTCEANVHVQSSITTYPSLPRDRYTGHIILVITPLASLRDGYCARTLFLRPVLRLRVLHCLGLVQGDVALHVKVQNVYAALQRKALRQLQRHGRVRRALQEQLCQLRSVLLHTQKKRDKQESNAGQGLSEGEKSTVMNEPMLQVEVQEEQRRHSDAADAVPPIHYVSRLFAIPSAEGLLAEQTLQNTTTAATTTEERDTTALPPLLTAHVPLDRAATRDDAMLLDVAVNAWVESEEAAAPTAAAAAKKEDTTHTPNTSAAVPSVHKNNHGRKMVPLTQGVWRVAVPTEALQTASNTTEMQSVLSACERHWLRLPLPVSIKKKPNKEEEEEEKTTKEEKEEGNDNAACVALLLEHCWRLDVRRATSCLVCLQLRTSFSSLQLQSYGGLPRRPVLRLCYGFTDGTRYIQDIALYGGSYDSEARLQDEAPGTTMKDGPHRCVRWCSAAGRVPRIGCFGAHLRSIALHECLVQTHEEYGKGTQGVAEGCESVRTVCLAERVWSAADEARLRSNALFWLDFTTTAMADDNSGGGGAQQVSTQPSYSILLQSVPCRDTCVSNDNDEEDDESSVRCDLTLAVLTIDVEYTPPPPTANAPAAKNDKTLDVPAPSHAQNAACSVVLTHTNHDASCEEQAGKGGQAIRAHSLHMTPAPQTHDAAEDDTKHTAEGAKAHWVLHWEANEERQGSLYECTVSTQELAQCSSNSGEKSSSSSMLPALRFAVDLSADPISRNNKDNSNNNEREGHEADGRTVVFAECSIADVLDALHSHTAAILAHLPHTCELPMYITDKATAERVPLPHTVLRVALYAHMRPADAGTCEGQRKTHHIQPQQQRASSRATHKKEERNEDDAMMKKIRLRDEVMYWASKAQQARHRSSTSSSSATPMGSKEDDEGDACEGCHGTLCVSLDRVTATIHHAPHAEINNISNNNNGEEDIQRMLSALTLCLSTADDDDKDEQQSTQALRTRLQPAAEPIAQAGTRNTHRTVELVPAHRLWLHEVALGHVPALQLSLMHAEKSAAEGGNNDDDDDVNAATACIGRTAVDLRPWVPEQPAALVRSDMSTSQAPGETEQKKSRRRKVRRAETLRTLTVTLPITQDNSKASRTSCDHTPCAVTVELSVLLTPSEAQVRARDYLRAYKELLRRRQQTQRAKAQDSNGASHDIQKAGRLHDGALYVLSSAVATRGSTAVLPGAVRCLSFAHHTAAASDGQTTLCVGGCEPVAAKTAESMGLALRHGHSTAPYSAALAYFCWSDAWRLAHHLPVSRRGIFAAPLIIHPVRDMHHWPLAHSTSSLTSHRLSMYTRGSKSSGTSAAGDVDTSAEGEQQALLLYEALHGRVGHVAVCLGSRASDACCCVFIDGGLQSHPPRTLPSPDRAVADEARQLMLPSPPAASSIACLSSLPSVSDICSLPPLRQTRPPYKAARKLRLMASPYLSTGRKDQRGRACTPGSSFLMPVRPAQPAETAGALRPYRRRIRSADEVVTPQADSIQAQHLHDKDMKNAGHRPEGQYAWHAMPSCVLFPSEPQRSYVVGCSEGERVQEEDTEEQPQKDMLCGYVGHCAACVVRTEGASAAQTRHTVWLFGGWKVTRPAVRDKEPQRKGDKDAGPTPQAAAQQQPDFIYTLCNDVRCVQLADAVDGLPVSVLRLPDAAITTPEAAESSAGPPAEPHTESATRWLRQSGAPTVACTAAMAQNEDIYLFGGLVNNNNAQSVSKADGEPLEATAALWRFDTRLLRWYRYHQSEAEGVQAAWPSARYGHSILPCEAADSTAGTQTMARYIVCGGATVSPGTQSTPQLIHMHDMLWMCYLGSDLSCLWRRIAIPPTAPIQPRFMPLLHLSRLAEHEGTQEKGEAGEQHEAVLIIAGGSNSLTRHEGSCTSVNYLLNWLRGAPLPTTFVECELC